MIQWNLSEQQADQVLNSLGQQPFLQVNGLIQELLRQIQDQQHGALTGQQTQGIGALRGRQLPEVPVTAASGALTT